MRWSTHPISMISMAWLLMPKIKYWLGWLLQPLCWSLEFCCASCGSGASAMCSTRVRRPQARGECSHLDVWKELKWSCSCFWWSFVLVGSSLRWSLASFPLLLWLLGPWRHFLVLNIHANRTASKLGQRVECETECCAKLHGEIPFVQCSNIDRMVEPKDSRIYGMLGCWSGRRCIGTWDGTCSAWTLAPCWWRSLCRLGPSWDAFVWFHLWTHE